MIFSIGNLYLSNINLNDNSFYEKKFNEFKKKAHDQLSVDGGGHLTYLAPSRVNLQLMQERYPDIQFRSTREH